MVVTIPIPSIYAKITYILVDFIFSYLSSQIDCKETLRRRDESIFLIVVPWGYGQPSSVYSLLPQRSSGVCLAWRFQRSQTRRLQKARNWRLVGETSGFIVLGYKHWGGLMKGGLLQWVFFGFFFCGNTTDLTPLYFEWWPYPPWFGAPRFVRSAFSVLGKLCRVSLWCGTRCRGTSQQRILYTKLKS